VEIPSTFFSDVSNTFFGFTPPSRRMYYSFQWTYINCSYVTCSSVSLICREAPPLQPPSKRLF
jgi:hypothetical protein